MYGAMGDLAARFRLMLSAGPPRGAPADMFNVLHCLQPSTFQSGKDVADGFEVRERPSNLICFDNLDMKFMSLCLIWSF
jgi:hypothetical protein